MGRILKAVLGNLPLKLSALLCAAVLWVYAWSATSSVRTITTGISLPLPAGEKASVVMPGGLLCPAWHVPVRLTVRGPARVVRSLEPSDLRAEFPAMETPPVGDSPVKLGKTDFAVPQGIVIVRIEPRELVVRVSDRRDGGESAP